LVFSYEVSKILVCYRSLIVFRILLYVRASPCNVVSYLDFKLQYDSRRNIILIYIVDTAVARIAKKSK